MMDRAELEYYLDNLRNSDPDYVVDVLDISSEKLVEVFYKEAIKFLESEYG